MKTGTVKWYHGDWMKGVITPDENADDVLFRQGVVENGVQLATGDRVEFESSGTEATLVRRL